MMPYAAICGQPTCACCTAWDGLYDRDRELLEKALGVSPADNHIIETLSIVLSDRLKDMARLRQGLMLIANNTGEGGTDWTYRMSVATLDPDHAETMGWPELKQLLDSIPQE